MAREVEKEDLALTSGIIDEIVYPEDDYVYPDIYDFDGEYVVAYSEEEAKKFMHSLSGTPMDELECELLTEEQINSWMFVEEEQQYDRTFAEELEDRLADEEVAPFYLGCSSDYI